MPQRKLSSFEDRLARLKDAGNPELPLTEAPPPPAPPASRLARVKAPSLLPDPAPKAAAAAAPRLPVAHMAFAAGLGLLALGAVILPDNGFSLPKLPASMAQMLSATPAEMLVEPVVLTATIAPDAKVAPNIGTLEAPVLPGLTLSDAPPVVLPVPAVAAPVAETVQAAAASPGLLDRLTAMVTGAPTEPALPPTMPVDFLPPAPAGWLRLTEAEANTPGALDRMRADWALLPDALPLEQNKGFGLLEQALAAPPPPAEQVQARAQALYLAGNGEFLSVTIKFRPARAAFGPPGDDMAWRQTLRAEVKRDAGAGDTVEALTLSGIAMFNRTRPEGKSRVSRPVGKEFTVPNGLKLTAALTHRAEVQANGYSTPEAAGALIASVDRKALGALLE